LQTVDYALYIQKIRFEFLKAHLWAAADILRRSLEPLGYRRPIMTLLFIKRFNDTFEENADKLIKERKEKNKHYVKQEVVLKKIPVTETKTITEEVKNERLADSIGKGIE
jgi:type I restriction-modification system DNA methylase subunit